MTRDSTRRQVIAGALSLAPGVATAGQPMVGLTVRTLDELREINPQQSMSVYCIGRYKSGDGGGGWFSWDFNFAEVDDDGCTIASTVSAVGRWRRECLSPLNPLWFGADPAGLRDSTAAFKAALAHDEDICIPAGTFRISDTLTIGRAGRRIMGAGQGATKIVMIGRNRPIIRWWGARTALENMQLEYEIPQQAADINSAGIMVDNTGPKNTHFLQKSAIRNVSVRNSYVGILVPANSVFFSVTVDNVEIDGYAKSAFYMAQGSSGTGSAILNLYTQNHRQECLGPVVQFSAIVDGFIGQINIEHTKVRDHALYFVSSDHVSISSVHIEGCDLLSRGKAFVAASGSIFISIDVLSVQFSEILASCSVFFLFGLPRISVRSLTLRDFQGSASLSPYSYQNSRDGSQSAAPELSVESVYLTRGASERLLFPVGADWLAGENAILRQWGRDVYFRHVNGSREYFGLAAPPSSGRFQIGDRVCNSRPSAGQPAWWICLESGSPGLWQAGPRI